MLRLALGQLLPAAHQKRPQRCWTIALLVMVATTIFVGAFVAGLHAGLVYNDFPRMEGQWIPDGILGLQPLWRNFFENTATVQFVHRILAISTLVVTVAAWLLARTSMQDVVEIGRA